MKPQARAVFEKRDDLITVRAPESLKRELTQEAVSFDRTLSTHVIRLLEDRKGRQGKQRLTDVRQAGSTVSY